MIDIFNIEFVDKSNLTSSDLYENIKQYFDNESHNLFYSYNNFDFYKKFNIDSSFNPNNLYFIINNKEIEVYSYILDLNKTSYNILEKYVYDIAAFHFKRLNIDFNEKYCIEYQINSKFNNNLSLHIDTRVSNKTLFNQDAHPFLSIITYLDDNNYPTIITNVEGNNEKSIKNKKVCLSFPKKGKQIVFEGGRYFHSACNIFDKNTIVNKMKGININRYVLVIFFWENNSSIHNYHLPSFSSIENNYNHFNKNSPLLKIHQIYNTKYILSNRYNDLFSHFFSNVIHKPNNIDIKLYYKFIPILISNGYNETQDNTFIIENY
jgi:hypothetical protein